MNTLVTCVSLTGNTRKIAEAIYAELARTGEADLIPVDKIDPDRIGAYDLVFIGAPIHARGLAAPAKNLLESIPDHPEFKLAAFITHASSAYSKHGYESGIEQVDDICKKKKINYLGCFDCQGRLTPELHNAVQKAQNIPDDEWAEKMAECDKHPNAQDEEKARVFARGIYVQAGL